MKIKCSTLKMHTFLRVTFSVINMDGLKAHRHINDTDGENSSKRKYHSTDLNSIGRT